MSLLGRDKKTIYFEELLGKIARGDNYAFETLYKETYKAMYMYIYNMALNEEDAKDILHDTYLKIRGAAHLYKGPGSPIGWMMKISKNIFLMKCRNNKKYDYTPLEDVSENVFLQFSDDENTTDRLFLNKLFENISKEDRDIIFMHVLMGLKHKEIGNILDMPTGTVLSRYHRSMKLLKRIGEI